MHGGKFFEERNRFGVFLCAGVCGNEHVGILAFHGKPREKFIGQYRPIRRILFLEKCLPPF